MVEEFEGIEKYLRNKDVPPGVAYQIALKNEQCGDFKMALRMYQYVTELLEGNGEEKVNERTKAWLYTDMGRVLISMKDFGEAARTLRKARGLLGPHEEDKEKVLETKFWMGELMYATGKLDAARALYTQIIQEPHREDRFRQALHRIMEMSAMIR